MTCEHNDQTVPLHLRQGIEKGCSSATNLCMEHGPQSSRLCPWNFLGKNTGVGCHFLLKGIYLTLPLSQEESPSVVTRALNIRVFPWLKAKGGNHRDSKHEKDSVCAVAGFMMEGAMWWGRQESLSPKRLPAYNQQGNPDLSPMTTSNWIFRQSEWC